MEIWGISDENLIKTGKGIACPLCAEADKMALTQGGMRPIFRDETETEKLDLRKFTTRPRPRKSGC